MNYKDKYRPTRFEEFVGSRSAAWGRRMIQNAPMNVALVGRFGTGKSTLAQLITQGLFCDAAQERKPCGECPNCRFVMAHWRKQGMFWIPGAELSRTDWFQVFDCTRTTPTQITYIQQEVAQYNRVPRVFVFDEFHRATLPTQEMFLQFLESSLPCSMVFCYALENAGRINGAVRQRLHLFELATPEPEELFRLVRRVITAERITLVEPSAEDALIEMCERNPRVIVNALEMVALQGEGLSERVLIRLEHPIRLLLIGDDPNVG